MAYCGGHRFGMIFYGPGPDPVNNTLSLDWNDLVGNVEVSAGGHTPLSGGSPHLCKYDVNLDVLSLENEPVHEDTTIVFAGPCPVTPASDGYDSQMSDDSWERIIFSGGRGKIAGSTGGPNAVNRLRIDMVGDDSHLLTRRAHLAADTSHGLPATLVDIAADGSTDVAVVSGSEDVFPDHTTGYVMDRPAQEDTPNGAYLDAHTAGYGMWTAAEWTTTYTADVIDSDPQTGWRPSWFGDWNSSMSYARQETITVNRAWLLQFADYGLDWGQFPKTIRLTGTGAFTGDFTHTSPAYVMDYEPATISTYVNNNIEADNFATHLGGMCAFTPHIRIFDLHIRLEQLWGKLRALSVSEDDADELCWKLGAARVGDLVEFQTDAVGSGVAPPAGCWISDDQLTAIVAPTIQEYNSDSPIPYNTHRITSINKQWTYAGGWFIRLGLQPHTTGVFTP